MRDLEKIYKFNGLIFRPAQREFAVEQTHQSIILSQTVSNLLLALVERAGDVVTYNELRLRIWPHEPEMSERVRHTMQVTKLQLVKLLQSAAIDPGVIESEPGGGYRLNAEVAVDFLTVQVLQDQSKQAVIQARSIPHAPPRASESLTMGGLLGSHAVFVVVSSTLYGMLFWVAMLLEAAYQFDVYGGLALVFGFAAMMINSVAMGSALRMAENRVRERRKALFLGFGILLAGVIGSALLASICLPNAPVTLTKLQAQPALAAFIKNALVYILPVGMFALFIPFYSVVSRRLKAERIITTTPSDALFIPPNALLVVCLAALLYSLVTTFYLLDNLQTGVYHGLFVSLVFLRFFIYFGLIFGSLLWYRTLNNVLSKSSGETSPAQTESL
jgi:DNA-binding winged helix-turn-helix (wHTH) protein